MKYFKEDLIKELKTEIGMRYGVYTRKVARGEMTEDEKEIKINHMRLVKEMIELTSEGNIGIARGRLELPNE